jgi:hypothetical protein
MGLPKIVYTPAGSSAVVLQFVNGPQNFTCYTEGRLHDNLATGGQARERVVENLDLMIEFTMPAMDLAAVNAWDLFMQFALAGGQFDFYPNSDINEQYHCVAEGKKFQPKRVGLQRYSESFRFRVLPDALAPAGPSQVLARFHGVAA